MDIDPNNTTFHSGQDDGSASFFSARSGFSTDNDDDEEVTIRVQRGLSNDHEDPRLAETLDSMIHQRRKFLAKGLANPLALFYRLSRHVMSTHIIEFPTPLLVSSFLLVAHYHHTSSSIS